MGHDKYVCKCHLRAYHVGQDEACFKAFVGDGNEWVIAQVRGLRKRSEGPGFMGSAFQDEIRGSTVGFQKPNYVPLTHTVQPVAKELSAPVRVCDSSSWGRTKTETGHGRCSSSRL